ncbi:MAG: macrolide ABC transporter ATP-binding protein/permease, partial [Chloroflexi bacterium]|nr:macrolide ABC transporter ATP-binding protein/permease [Chloroflexota bacterium]
QQRVAIARALVNEPAVILADEPTGELDSSTAETLMTTLRGLNGDRGVTVIIVTHDAGIAGATDRVVRLSDGKVVADEDRDSRRFARALSGEPMGNAIGNGNGAGGVWALVGDLLERARAR